MQLKVTRQGPVAILHPAAQVDGRAAFQFEQDVLELLQDANTRHVVVDFSAVTLMASAGIRVLILLLHKVEARDGMLVLCGLTQYVRNVLDVSGLTSQFTLAATIDEAVRAMPAAGGEDQSESAVLARRVVKLLSLGGARPAVAAAASMPEAVAQPLAARVARTLSRRR